MTLIDAMGPRSSDWEARAASGIRVPLWQSIMNTTPGARIAPRQRIMGSAANGGRPRV